MAPSPKVEVTYDDTGFAAERLGSVPAPYVHPRLLFGPDDLPDLRHRLEHTECGRLLMENLRRRTNGSILAEGNWEHELFTMLADGDTSAALALLNQNQKPNTRPGQYQPYMLYSIVMEAFDALISDDPQRGIRVAAAVAGYARMVEPLLEECLAMPMADDVWRVKVQGPTTGAWSDSQGLRDLMGYHLLGYAYDFTYPFMTDSQRQDVRHVIARATFGRVWLGARIPHHFRNWNWVMVAMGQPLLALAIEGEEGYDPRVYHLAVEICRDYLTYGISAQGCSTEAVGYTQFGFVWSNPFIVAAARRGDNLLTHSHFLAMNDWYLHSLEPFGQVWSSHGDGADRGPSVMTMMMWKRFFSNDPTIDFVWQNAMHQWGKDQRSERIHLIEPLCWATDGAPNADYQAGAALQQPLTWFDPDRGSLITRNAWAADAAAVQFECRTDSHCASHEHADRGNFTFSALGRSWAKENFRSIESRHHNVVLVDGMGQGFWPGAGRWLGLVENDHALIAACDARDAYAYWSPKQIISEDPDPENTPRFRFGRWDTYAQEAAKFHRDYAGVPIERDTRPSVVAFWQGFEFGDPRMWDEDAWPVRLPHNPVAKAFRTLAFVRQPQPYLLIADDIRKDDRERLYEWLMQTSLDTEAAQIKTNEIILCDASVPRDDLGRIRPRKGDRCLLVRVLDMADPADKHQYQSRPSLRLETFERKDTTTVDGRTFGTDKRLVIASRSAEPRFKILLFPFRHGEELPQAQWTSDRQHLTVTVAGVTDEFSFFATESGRTLVTIQREGVPSLSLD